MQSLVRMVQDRETENTEDEEERNMNTIIKRDGKEAKFDESKIFNAIYAANKAVDGE